MEFTLTICQKQIHDNFPGLDIKDAGIIDFLGRFSHDCTKKIEYGKVYYWFDYGKVASECPLLRLESEAIRKRMRVMCSMKIFEAHPENRGGRIFFAFGERYSLTHRDRKEKEREENPDIIKKRTGRKSRPQREENPVLGQKEREENPENHKDHSNHNNQESLEPEIDGLKIELHDNEIPGAKLIDFLKSAKKEKTPQSSARPPKKEKTNTPQIHPENEPHFSYFSNPDKAKAAWMDWIEYKYTQHREKYKDAKTELSKLRQLFKQFNGDSTKLEEAVSYSTGNLYKGIFAPKIEKENGKFQHYDKAQQHHIKLARFVADIHSGSAFADAGKVDYITGDK